MAIPITNPDLEARLGAGEVSKFSRGVPGNVTVAIAQAWDAARSAALNVFTADSWDALTADTLPPEAKLHIVSHACAILSAGHNAPEFIASMATEAARWRGYLAGDKVRSFDAVLTKLDHVEDSVSYKVPEKRFFDRKESDYWGVPKR